MSKDLEIDWATATKTYVNTNLADHAVPIHPHYASLMNPHFKIGDLVEIYDGRIGLIKELEEQSLAVSIYVRGANNQYYKVLVNGEEKIYVGYSLKKIEKK